MSLEVFYATVDGNLDDVRSRLMTDERITKFLGIFFQDPSYDNLVSNMESGNIPEAFRAAHTLKGISKDMGLLQIAGPATELADALRPDDAGNPANLDAAPALLEQVTEAYVRATDAKDLI